MTPLQLVNRIKKLSEDVTMKDVVTAHKSGEFFVTFRLGTDPTPTVSIQHLITFFTETAKLINHYETRRKIKPEGCVQPDEQEVR